MNNKNVYTDICERLAAQVAELKHINEFDNQFADPDRDYSKGFPAAALEFGEADFDDGFNYGVCSLTVHVATDNLPDTHLDPTLGSTFTNTAGLSSYDLVKAVEEALVGFATANCHGFKRMAHPPKESYKGLIVRKVRFEFGLKGC